MSPEPISKERTLVTITATLILLSFSIFLLPDRSVVCYLGKEDGFFESLTAVFFLGASVVTFLLFRKTKNWFFLLFSIIFLVAMGEEISWGQRIWGFSTPAAMKTCNVQGEFNIHNLEPFNSRLLDGSFRLGWERIRSVDFLYKVFWFSFGIILPLGYSLLAPIRRLVEKIRLPVPPLSLGILFLLNYLIMKSLPNFIPGYGLRETMHYFDAGGEIYECGTALIFMVLSIYFWKKTGNSTQRSTK